MGEKERGLLHWGNFNKIFNKQLIRMESDSQRINIDWRLVTPFFSPSLERQATRPTIHGISSWQWHQYDLAVIVCACRYISFAHVCIRSAWLGLYMWVLMQKTGWHYCQLLQLYRMHLCSCFSPPPMLKIFLEAYALQLLQPRALARTHHARHFDG